MPTPEELDATPTPSDDESHDSEMAAGDLAARLDQIAMGDRPDRGRVDDRSGAERLAEAMGEDARNDPDPAPTD